MKKHTQTVIIALFSFILLSVRSLNPAQAADPASWFAVGPEIGTTGIGGLATFRLMPEYLNLNLGYSGFGFGYIATVDGQNYKAHFTLGGAPIYISAYPFGNNFHFDAGLFINRNRIALHTPAPAGSDGPDGQSLGEISGETHFAKVAPYLGIGWGNPFLGGKWTFIASAGVILEGGAKASLGAANENDVPDAAEDIASQQATFNHDISFLSAFPVINLGIEYRF